MSATLEERPTQVRLQRLALDLTRKCQASCLHCFNHSSPLGTHGTMTRQDWLSLLDQSAPVGVTQVQFIGGEVTLHPDLPELIAHARQHHMDVEVFTNLIHISEPVWQALKLPGVRVGTSFYSDQAEQHEAITRSPGSHRYTLANIKRAVDEGIQLRAEITQVTPELRVYHAGAQLADMGLAASQIDIKRMRDIGRAADGGPQALSELCGHCAGDRAAVMPNGDVAGCVMSGGLMTAGNVLQATLVEILGSPQWQVLSRELQRVAGGGEELCGPYDDEPCGAAHHVSR